MTEEERYQHNLLLWRNLLDKGSNWEPDESLIKSYIIGCYIGQGTQMIAFSKIGKAFTLGSKAAPWVQNLITNTGSGAISQAIVSYGEGKSSSEILMSSASVGIVSGGSGLFMEKILAPFA